jgi:hypothetical protein
MTSWQDQPPLTRRQAREVERAQQRDATASDTAPSGPRRAATIAPTPAGEVPDLTTSYSFTSAPRDETAAADDDRASQSGAQDFGSLSFDSLLTAPGVGESAASVFPGGGTTTTQVAPSLSAEPVAATQHEVVPADAAPAESVVSTSAAPTFALPTTTPEGRPLTRREMRALREASGETATPGPSEAARAEAPPRAATPLPAAPVDRVALVDGAASGGVPTPSLSFVRDVPAVPVSGAGPTASDPSAVSTPTTDPQLIARAAGHWSTMDDEAATTGGSRSAVATGSVTTANALILPSVPSEGLTTSPLTASGDVIVTGTIDLPASLGSTGQHPDHFDSSDIDRLFEEADAAPATASVAPVRASRAVATHTSTRGMIAPPKSRGNKLPLALAITAAFLALGVGALLVAGFVFHAF